MKSPIGKGGLLLLDPIIEEVDSKHENSSIDNSSKMNDSSMHLSRDISTVSHDLDKEDGNLLLIRGDDRTSK